jgi:hypothetical protein
MSKAWKQAERRIARYLGSTRTPLSGGNGKQTRSDTLHPSIFVEIKQRRRHTTYTLYRNTKNLARKEKKVPLVVLDEVRAPGQLFVIHSDDLPALIAALIQSNKACRKSAQAVLTQLTK